MIGARRARMPRGDAAQTSDELGSLDQFCGMIGRWRTSVALTM
jgi:hypothetical protein